MQRWRQSLWINLEFWWWYKMGDSRFGWCLACLGRCAEHLVPRYSPHIPVQREEAHSESGLSQTHWSINVDWRVIVKFFIQPFVVCLLREEAAVMKPKVPVTPESATSSSQWQAHWWASWWSPRSLSPLWTSERCTVCGSACHLLTRTGGTANTSDTWNLENTNRNLMIS